MLKNILKEQIRIFEESITLEKEKRRTILETKGQELEKLLERSEQCILKLEALDKSLTKEIHDFLGIGQEGEKTPTLRELLEYSQKNKPEEFQELEKLTERYRELGGRLKEHVEANQELLVNTKDRIQGLLGDLQAKEQSLLNNGYSPASNSTKQRKPGLRQTNSRLLNTGA